MFKIFPATVIPILLLFAVGVSQQCAQGQTQLARNGALSGPRSVAQSTGKSTVALPGYVTNKAVTENETSAAAAALDRKGYVAGDFLATTTSLIEGYVIVDYKGLVEGASVRVPTWSEDAAAGAREVYGGSIDSYAQLCEEARIQAFTTMVERAKKLGANAVIGIHFDSQVMPLDKGKFATGVVCVGTAVVARHKNSL